LAKSTFGAKPAHEYMWLTIHSLWSRARAPQPKLFTPDIRSNCLI